MEESDECLGCKLVRGFGLLGLSGYIAYNSRFYKLKQRPVGLIVSAVFAVCGIVALFDLYPNANRKSLHSSEVSSLHTQFENNENN